MRVEIKGAPMPVAFCYLNENERLITEKGAMSWMTPNLEMETVGGGFTKMMSKAFSGEAMFHNVYTARNGSGMIAMASSFPGEIREYDLSNGDIIAQKKAFLAREESVDMSIFFQKKFSSGFFGGEGFIMQKFSGKGKVLLEFDGSIFEYTLQAGESMMIDSGNLAMMEATCTLEVEKVKGAKNIFLGGEGIFNSKVTGPGKVLVQSMPVSTMAQAISPYIVSAK